MQYDSPKPTRQWGFGWSHLLKPLPKFAARIGAAMTAMSLCGVAYNFMIDSDASWAKTMAILGVLGAGISALFGKK